MTANGYAMIAQVRFRELKTRIGLAAFIALTGWFLTQTFWPAVWLGAVVVTQVLDWIVFRPLRLRPEREPSLGYKVALCATASFNVLVYSGIAAYLWAAGGDAGRLFAMVQVAGGLLHVSLHMHHVRPLLYAAVIPHSLYFLGMPQDIYFQVGLLTLIGLAAKNAILIVEFAAHERKEGKSIVEAALEAARLRLRPILMTSLAFVLGVLPLAVSTGAGAAGRRSIGTGIMGGMIAATFLAIVFVPLFFVIIQTVTEKFSRKSAEPSEVTPATEAHK